MDASKSSFYQHLLSLTKTEIDDIRILFDCDVKSGLKKQDLALAVADYFLNESEYWMRRLPCTDIQFIDQILDAGPGKNVDVGYLPYESILEEYGIVNVEYDDDENCSFSVDEFMYKAFKTGIDNAKAFMMAKDCIQYEALVRGALNVYGVLPYDDMVSLLKSAEPIISAESGYYNPQPSWIIYLSEALLLNIYVFSYKDEEYFVNPTIEDPEYFVKGQLSRKALGYKEFSFEELQKAGSDPPFCSVGADFPQSKALMKVLRKYANNFDEVIDYDNFYCIAQYGITGIIDLVTEELVFPSISATNKFIGLVNEFSNHIPHWSLKGWSPAEVFQKFDKPRLNLNHGQLIQSPLDTWSDRMMKDVFNLPGTVKKVGRNEPCPCGSGKKYKDCHGKYQS